MRSHLFQLIFHFIFCAAFALAQATSSIEGITTDTTGLPVSGITITLIHAGDTKRVSAETDSKGYYKFADLAPGTYSLVIAVPGLEPFATERIEVKPQATIRANLEIKRSNAPAAKPQPQLADLKAAVAAKPDDFQALLQLSQALLQARDTEGAKLQLQEFIKTHPDAIPPRLALAQVQIALNEWENAMNSGKQVLALKPNDLGGRLFVSTALMGMRQFPQARKYLEETLKLYPTANDARYQLAFVSLQEKKADEAEKLYLAMYHSEPPDFRGLLGLTEVLALQGKIEEALTTVKKEIELHPQISDLKIAYGNLAVRANKAQEGLKYYKQVFDKNPNDGSINLRMALAYRQIGDVQNAVESFGRAIDLLPNDPAPLAELAMLLHTTGNVGRARLLYEKVLTIQPDNEIALNNLASIISEDGSDLNRALQLADRAKKKSPNDPNIADTLGTIYLKRGFPSLAIDLFLDLVKNFPTHPNAPTFNMHLGMAYSQKGDRAEAKTAFEAALKLKPDEKLTKEIQSLLKQLE